MNAELKAKWVAALRSGEYKQGQRHLHADGKFCCLGVLREIQEPGARYANDMTACLYPGHQGGLDYDQMDYLANGMNDKGKSFFEIARYIEDNL